jgi:alkylation response protein AidB-like acyl-CoA dehydrogenase
VNFQLTDEQEALRDGVRTFCEGRIPAEQLAVLEETGGFTHELWSELAELGVFSLRVPEADGGVGLGAADAVLVFAELGRRLVPGPVAWTHLAAPLIKGAELGDVVVGGLDLVGPQPAPMLVEHLADCDALIVIHRDRVVRIDPGSLDATEVAVPLDPLTPLHHLSTLPDGERIGGADVAAELRLGGSLLAAAQLFGIAEATCELAVAYAKQREQFGRTIGSFQAMKHILADMFVQQEVARAAVYAAGATLDQPEVGDPVRAVCAAKIICGEAAHKNARACIQVHGGMGYTWEVPAHYYLKRAWVLNSSFGSTDEYSERLATQVAAQA